MLVCLLSSVPFSFSFLYPPLEYWSLANMLNAHRTETMKKGVMKSIRRKMEARCGVGWRVAHRGGRQPLVVFGRK